MATNPRYKNGNLRRKHRARFKAMAAPCGICGGEIHYDEPSDAKHPLSFVIDEKYPVSRYREWGYATREEAAQDWNNLQAAHFVCNSQKKAMTMTEMKNVNVEKPRVFIPDGEW